MRTPWAWLLALFSGALAISLFRIGAKDLWFDEAVSATLVRFPLPSDTPRLVLRSEVNGVLHLLLLHLWSIFGRGEGWLRSLSALCAAASVPVTFLLGARLWSRRAGLAAALLLGVNGFFLRYAQEARMYALLLLLSTLSWLLFLRALDLGTKRAWWAYALASALLIPAHLLGGLIAVSQAAALFAMPRRPPLRTLTLVAVLVATLDSPLLGWFILHRESHQIDWLPAASPVLLFNFYKGMAGTRVLLAGWAIFAAAGLTTRAGRLVAPWLLLPPLLLLALSFLARPLFLDRYLIGVLPAFALAAAAGLDRLPSRWFAGALAAMLCLAMVPCYRWYRTQRSDWRPMTQALLDRRQPGDALLVLPDFEDVQLRYYLEVLGGEELREIKLQELNAASRVWVAELDDKTGSPAQRQWVDDARAALALKREQLRLGFGKGLTLRLFTTKGR